MVLSEWQQKTLVFLAALAQEADDAARAGDLSLANAMGRNAGAQFYFTNVHKLRSVTPEFYAVNYPQFMAEASRLHEAYTKDQQQEDRITTLEAKLDEAMRVIEALKEAQTEPAKPKTKRKAKAKVTEADAEVDAETDDTPDTDEPDADDGEDTEEAD
jgi:cyclophilin family peptidyl-prolyl cis-trans isomerase